MVRFSAGRLVAIAAVSLAANAMAQPVGFDFDNDGAPDYLVTLVGFNQSDPSGGAVRIWSGGALSILDTIYAPETNSLYGWSTGSAGDLNGDGHDDLIVGEPLYSANDDREGRITVLSGSDRSVLLTVDGPYIDTGFGRYVTGINDWNGDTTPDIAVSGWDIADTDSDGIGDDAIGMVYIVSGADGSILNEIMEPTADERFGYAVFSLGDVNGDGLADIAVADPRAPGASGSGAEGAIYIWTGRATGEALTLTEAHRVILNDDSTIRRFASQIDVMRSDLWLDEATIQVVSLTDSETGGTTEAECLVDIFELDGGSAGTKGIKSSVVLAGDANADGVVNIADVHLSVDEQGTVIDNSDSSPIVDSNGDGVVDTFDIAVVLGAYGNSTDLYEGLEDPSRLLGITMGASGFGRTPPGGLGGVGGTLGDGRRPIDDCLRNIELPPLRSDTLVPALLQLDARTNCGECTSPDDDPGCWECEDYGNLVGGSVTASPDQPKPGDTFTFTASGVTDTGGSWTCTCGDDQQDIQSGNPVYRHCVVTRNGDGSWPDPPPISDPCWQNGDTTDPITAGSACTEYRAYFRATVDRDCQPDAIIVSGEAQVAEFTIDWECVAEVPVDRKRNKLGIGEAVKVWIPEGDAGAVWTVSPNAAMAVDNNGERFIRASVMPGSVSVTAEINGCRRTKNFTVIAPNRVNYTKCPNVVWHTQGLRNLRYMLWMDLDPDDVSFYAVEMREVSGPASNITGDFLIPPASTWYHNAGPPRRASFNNIIAQAQGDGDLVGSESGYPHGNGGFDWVIPLECRVIGELEWISLGSVTQSFRLVGDCLTVSKDGDSHEACLQDPTIEPNWNDPQCPPGF